MRVLNIVAGDLHGGAAQGALYLHNALLEFGVDSYLLVQKTDNESRQRVLEVDDFLSKIYIKLNSLLNFIYKKLFLRSSGSVFNLSVFGLRTSAIDRLGPFDIVHLHWVAGFVGINTLLNLKANVIWTMRDIWAVTGGCHYPLKSCVGYSNGCNSCPMVKSNVAQKLVAMIYRYKKFALIKNETVLVGVSRWCQAVADAALKNASIKTHTIHNLSEIVCKDQNLLNDKRKEKPKDCSRVIVVSVAMTFAPDYKGAVTLRRLILDESLTSRFHFIIIGDGFESQDVVGANATFIPRVSKRELANFYLHADIYLTTSVFDALPKTCLEAQSFGLPIISFANTGHLDLVDHRENGFLARNDDYSDLKAGLEWYYRMGKSEREALSKRARMRYEWYSDRVSIVNQYIKLYNEIL